jgi:quinol monooxygenase YgiN
MGEYGEPVTIIAHIRARPGYETIVEGMLKRLAQATLAEEEGCLVCSLHVSLTGPKFFMTYQTRTSEKQLEAHGSMPHTAGFSRAASSVLDGPIATVKYRKIE